MAKPVYKVTYIEFNGTERTVDVTAGRTIMEGASRNMVPGIEAECGGSLQCSTCHIYVDPKWIEKIGFATGMEKDMLELAGDVRPNSRLACQIKLTEELNGIIVHTPEKQTNVGT